MVRGFFHRRMPQWRIARGTPILLAARRLPPLLFLAVAFRFVDRRRLIGRKHERFRVSH